MPEMATRVDLDGPPIADGEWHTLSCSFDRNGAMRMYTDGVLSDETPMSSLGNLDVGGLFFGADPHRVWHGGVRVSRSGIGPKPWTPSRDRRLALSSPDQCASGWASLRGPLALG